MRFTFLLSAALALAAGLASASAEEATPLDEAAIAAALKDYDGNHVVGTLDGEEITLSDVAIAYSGLPPQAAQVPADQVMKGLVTQIGMEKLLVRAAAEEGFDESPVLARKLEVIRRATIAQEYMAAKITEQLTDEKIKAEYDKQFGDVEPLEEINARHILVSTEDEAKDVAEAARKADTDFAQLAKEKSTGPSGARGGDLGWFVFDDMVPEFAEVAFALETGEVSSPVKSQFGWHVIKLEERRERAPPKLEDLAPQIRAMLSEQVAAEIVAQVRGDAEIEMSEDVPPAEVIRSPLAIGEE